MATSQKLTEHFLTCSVCFEMFKNPCTLSCDHTFCEECVVTYTKTRPNAITAKSLPCPFCRRLTKVPDPHRPVEEWAGQLKSGFLLRGLVDSFGPGPRDLTNCKLCQEEGETTAATAWCPVCDVSLCNTCLKAHRRIPSTRHHDVADLSGNVKVTRKRRVMCTEHEDEYIKFYCKDCKKILCQSCCIIYHRKCESVTSLESMVPELRVTLEARKESLGRKILDEEKQRDTRKSQCDNMKQRKSSIQSQMRSALKKKEKQLMNELDEITDKQMGQLKEDIKTGDMAIQIYKQQSEFIDQALNSDSEVDMYDLYQSCESGTAESVGDTDVKNRGTRVEFSLDMDKMNKTLDRLTLEKILQWKYLFPNSVPVLKNTIDCRTPSDKCKTDIWDVTSMVVDNTEVLVVSDFCNTCIKSFYNRDSQPLHSRLQLQNKPRRITRLHSDTLAVTLLGVKQIITVKVTPDLSLLSSITTSKVYYGLTTLTPTTLAGGSQYPPCVDILDRSGNVLQSISPLNNGQKIIKYPFFLCTTRKGDILVSDGGTNSVLCLTSQGDVVFNYSPTGDRALDFPSGITSTNTGDILVADKWGHKVIHLSETGQFIRDLLTSNDGVSQPYGVEYDEKRRILVTKDCQFVSFFTFQ